MAVGEYRRCEWRRRGIRGKVSGLPVEREKEREADMRDGLTQWGKGERNETEGTASGKVTAERGSRKNIREYEGRFSQRYGERERSPGGGENTRTKMSSSDPDLRRQGNRRWARTSSPSPRAAGNREIFAPTFTSGAPRGWLAIKKAASAPWPRRSFN